MTLRETNVTHDAGTGGAGAGGGPIRWRDRVAELGAEVDHRWPGLVRLLAAARWGGLRTVHPTPGTWAVVAATGSAGGLGIRELVRRATARRPPVAVAVGTGVAAAWFGVWRWDSARFARTRVTLVPDLAPDDLDALVEHLAGTGVAVEAWDGPVRADGRARGLVCRVRDVRTVNRLVDEWVDRPVRTGSRRP
jgi:hypothetical protein